jgi:iron complex transport system substrate-binding protein
MGGHNTLAAGMTFFRQRIFLAGCLWWVTVTPWLFGGASPAGVTVYPLTLTDGAGRTVTLPAAPRRIVSLSPAITDLVVAVGAGDELAGITRYCTAPAGHADIARVGGLDDPDYERILALQPDLVLVPSLKDPALLNKLEVLGLRVVVMHAEGLDHLGPDFQLVGQATGREASGDALARQWGTLRDLVHRRLRGAPRPSAIVIYGPGLLAPGPEGFAGQLLDEAGASNVVPAGSTAWQELAPEALLRLDPAVIFIVSDDTAPWPATPALRNLTAVRAGQVIRVPTSLFMKPGPEQGEALWLLARSLHPALFPEGSAETAVARETAVEAARAGAAGSSQLDGPNAASAGASSPASANPLSGP